MGHQDAAPPVWLSCADLASRWSVSRRTVARWCADGVLPSMRVGGLYRISLNIVLAAEIAGTSAVMAATERDPAGRDAHLFETTAKPSQYQPAARDGRNRTSQLSGASR